MSENENPRPKSYDQIFGEKSYTAVMLKVQKREARVYRVFEWGLGIAAALFVGSMFYSLGSRSHNLDRSHTPIQVTTLTATSTIAEVVQPLVIPNGIDTIE